MAEGELVLIIMYQIKHVSVEGLTTGLLIPLGTNNPPAEVLT